VALFCSDFSKIEDGTVVAHNSTHQSDVGWLNSQIENIVLYEPHREIVVFTHYSPTMLEVAIYPAQLQDVATMLSAFATDLSDHLCWTSTNIRVEPLDTVISIVISRIWERRSELWACGKADRFS
jgi:hypothetical protein